MRPAFTLDRRLQADCHLVGDWPLCSLLLMDDARWPWFILVPRRVGLRELCDMDGGDRAQLWRESTLLAIAMRCEFAPHKLNVAALGNVVEQLHLHHVARWPGDPAWPAPVWGFGNRVPYTEAEQGEAIARILERLPSPPVPPRRCAADG